MKISYPDKLHCKSLFAQIALSVLLSIFGLLWQSVGQITPQQDTKNPTILVHYMPWYMAKPVSDVWGWHWTMNHFDPDKIVDGQRELASHFRPLIGAYDSNDPDLLECQVLMMKYAGISGVIIDWYGIEDHFDYALTHRNTQHLIKYIKKAGLQYAICYEDQTINQLVASKKVKPDEKVKHGKQVMRWLHDNCFQDKHYVRVDGQPVLMVFGPQGFTLQQLRETVSELPTIPQLFVLPHLTPKSAKEKVKKQVGIFGWPPVTGGKEIPVEKWQKYLDNLYRRHSNGTPVIASVFPGFTDIYQQAELHDSYGAIDSRDGQTFADTFKRALESKTSLIQIATWNDYGEGTMIEPTRELGFKYLEETQRRTKKLSKGVGFEKRHLQLPVKLFELRKNLKDRKAELEQASKLLFGGKPDEANLILDRLSSKEN